MPNRLPAPHANGNVNAVDVLGTLSNLTFDFKGQQQDLFLKLVRSRGKDQCIYLQYWIESDTADDVFAFADVAEPIIPLQSAAYFMTHQRIRNFMGEIHDFCGTISGIKTKDGEEAVSMLFQDETFGDYTVVIGVISTGYIDVYEMDAVYHTFADLDDFS